MLAFDTLFGLVSILGGAGYSSWRPRDWDDNLPRRFIVGIHASTIAFAGALYLKYQGSYEKVIEVPFVTDGIPLAAYILIWILGILVIAHQLVVNICKHYTNTRLDYVMSFLVFCSYMWVAAHLSTL